MRRILGWGILLATFASFGAAVPAHATPVTDWSNFLAEIEFPVYLVPAEIRGKRFHELTPPQRALLQEARGRVEAALHQLFENLVVSFWDEAAQKPTPKKLFQRLRELEREVAAKIATVEGIPVTAIPEVDIRPSGGVVRSALAYLYMEIRANLVHGISPEETLRRISVSTDPIAGYRVRGVGSDFDVYLARLLNEAHYKAFRDRISSETGKINAHYGLVAIGHKGMQRSHLTIMDVKPMLTIGTVIGQEERSVKGGGATADLINYSMRDRVLAEPLYRYDSAGHRVPVAEAYLVNDWLLGTTHYIRGIPEDADKQNTRAFRVCFEQPFERYAPEDEALLLEDLNETIERIATLPSGAEIPKTVVEQFQRIVRNSWVGLANNRIYRNPGQRRALDAAIRKLAELVGSRVNRASGLPEESMLPPFVESLPRAAAAQLPEIPAKFLVPADRFFRDFVKDHTAYHGTPNIDIALAFMHGGLRQTTYETGFRRGAYFSPSYAVSLNYARNTGVVIPLRFRKDYPLRVLDLAQADAEFTTRIAAEAKAAHMEAADWLSRIYGVDVVILSKDEYILKNIDVLEHATLANITDAYGSFADNPQAEPLARARAFAEFRKLNALARDIGEMARIPRELGPFVDELAASAPDKNAFFLELAKIDIYRDLPQFRAQLTAMLAAPDAATYDQAFAIGTHTLDPWNDGDAVLLRRLIDLGKRYGKTHSVLWDLLQLQPTLTARALTESDSTAKRLRTFILGGLNELNPGNSVLEVIALNADAAFAQEPALKTALYRYIEENASHRYRFYPDQFFRMLRQLSVELWEHYVTDSLSQDAEFDRQQRGNTRTYGTRAEVTPLIEKLDQSIPKDAAERYRNLLKEARRRYGGRFDDIRYDETLRGRFVLIPDAAFRDQLTQASKDAHLRERIADFYRRGEEDTSKPESQRALPLIREGKASPKDLQPIIGSSFGSGPEGSGLTCQYKDLQDLLRRYTDEPDWDGAMTQDEAALESFFLTHHWQTFVPFLLMGPPPQRERALATLRAHAAAEAEMTLFAFTVWNGFFMPLETRSPSAETYLRNALHQDRAWRDQVRQGLPKTPSWWQAFFPWDLTDADDVAMLKALSPSKGTLQAVLKGDRTRGRALFPDRAADEFHNLSEFAQSLGAAASDDLADFRKARPLAWTEIVQHLSRYWTHTADLAEQYPWDLETPEDRQLLATLWAAHGDTLASREFDVLDRYVHQTNGIEANRSIQSDLIPNAALRERYETLAKAAKVSRGIARLCDRLFTANPSAFAQALPAHPAAIASGLVVDAPSPMRIWHQLGYADSRRDEALARLTGDSSLRQAVLTVAESQPVADWDRFPFSTQEVLDRRWLEARRAENADGDAGYFVLGLALEHQEKFTFAGSDAIRANRFRLTADEDAEAAKLIPAHEVSAFVRKHLPPAASASAEIELPELGDFSDLALARLQQADRAVPPEARSRWRGMQRTVANRFPSKALFFNGEVPSEWLPAGAMRDALIALERAATQRDRIDALLVAWLKHDPEQFAARFPRCPGMSLERQQAHFDIDALVKAYLPEGDAKVRALADYFVRQSDARLLHALLREGGAGRDHALAQLRRSPAAVLEVLARENPRNAKGISPSLEAVLEALRADETWRTSLLSHYLDSTVNAYGWRNFPWNPERAEDRAVLAQRDFDWTRSRQELLDFFHELENREHVPLADFNQLTDFDETELADGPLRERYRDLRWQFQMARVTEPSGCRGEMVRAAEAF